MIGSVNLKELIKFLEEMPEDCPVHMDYDSCYGGYPTGIRFQGDHIVYLICGDRKITAEELLDHIRKKMDSREIDFPDQVVYSRCPDDGRMYVATSLETISDGGSIYCEPLDDEEGN